MRKAGFRDRAMRALDRVPSLSVEATDLLASLASRHVETRRLVDIIQSDSSLEPRVLELANSGAFGKVRRIDSVPHAVGLVGAFTLRQHLIRWTIRSAVRDLPDVGGWSGAKFTAHAEATALLADNLCDHLPITNGDGACIAGLVHDIGKFFICAEAPETIEFILTMRDSSPESISEVERDVLGIDHAEISSLVARRWRLGDDVCQAIRHHHEPQHDPSTDEIALSFVLSKADSYVNGLGVSFMSSAADAMKTLDWPGYENEVQRALQWFEYMYPQSALQTNQQAAQNG